MRRSRSALARAVVAAMAALVAAPWMSATPTPLRAQTPAQRPPAFRTRVEIISVNVVVRDKAGNVVRDLTANDFTLVEDDKPQTITAFSFEEVATAPSVVSTLTEQSQGPVQAILKPTPAPKPTPTAAPDATAVSRIAPPGAPADAPSKAGAIDLRNRRLVVLLFDVSSMQPEELTRAVESARRYVDERITQADLIAVASVATNLRIDQDFTAEREALVRALDRFSGAEAGGFEDNATPALEETSETAEGFSPDESEFNIFNTDRRLQAIEMLAEAMAPIQQKKAVIYFSSGMRRTGQDNQVQLRAAIDRASKANVSLYPVDTRGLTAVVPGGEARQASKSDTSMFSGRAVASQFDRLAGSQETLVTLASGTGGRAFLDTNDFGAVYTRVIADTSAYYLLGYSSTNPARDGRFRRLKLRVNRAGLTVEHRPGYFADSDFAHGNRADRERQLQDQLVADLSATDLPVWLSTGFFRVAADRFYVPVSLAVPGSQIPFTRSSATDRATLDVIGSVRDAQRRPVGKLRDTVKLSLQPAEDVRRKNVQYETGFTLPPGKYTLKVVVRENQSGVIGSFETDVAVPDLRRAPVRISSVVVGTQIQKATGFDRVNPLARDGTKLIPSVTHVVSTKQPLYFYYEVYEPAAGQTGNPRLLTSIAFFRGRLRTYETPLVEVTRLSAPDRKAAVFQFSIPASALKPGLYTCQINVVDDVAGAFVFPRFPLLVRP